MTEMSLGFDGMPVGFSAVSLDELTHIEGGKGFWSKVWSVAEKVVVGVATALVVKKLS
jgi:hypothetical protein